MYELNYNILQEIIEKQISDLNKNRDTILKQALQKAGYVFNTEAELLLFAKEKCRIEQSHDKRNVLFAENKPVLEWKDMPLNPKIEIHPDGSVHVSSVFWEYRFLV